MNPALFLTATLRSLPHGAAVTRILAAAVAAVEPGAAVRRFLRRDGERLIAGDRVYHLRDFDRCWIVGAGKAGAPMAAAAASILGERVTGGVVVVKEGHVAAESLAVLQPRIDVIEAGHPIPDARGVAAGERIADLLQRTGERDLVLALISGGGSALLTRPAPGITLDDLQRLTGLLLACGASIHEINTLRRHLDTLKGGGLARLAAPAAVVTLVLSDVVGDPLDVIASGPTVADPTTFADALGVLERYELVPQTPVALLERLRRGARGEIDETPKPGDPVLVRVHNLIIGSNRLAAEAALAAARNEGFNTLLLTTFLQGEARVVGRVLAAIAREMLVSNQPIPRPACVIAGGETTVTLRGDGLGGRNQELALAAAADLAGIPGALLVTLATDGGDGPTDAAGAVVSDTTIRRAAALGIDAAAALARNDSYPFFAALDDLLKPGPTQTNVNDLAIVVAV
ncbi:glycerate kinase type-2 family protein [Roseiflexus castenholzii]|uniref:glycerate kinase type-2 family protein n=1 Tax=Roseiflexus castenholzii TaxID=120962 RepID=UPI003C7BB7A6